MAAVLLSSTMAQNNNSNVNDDVKPSIFHDFLGRGCAPAANCAGSCDVSGGGSPSASASASRAGGPISTTSDLGSDRQVGSHLEGVPFYGQRSEFSGSEIGNRYSGSKRSNSDSVFVGSSRDAVPQMRPDFPESSHLMKMLRNIAQEQPKRLHEDEAFMGAYPMRPTSASLTIQPAVGGKNDANASKWERAIPVNVGPVLQYPPRAGQVVPYAYQALSNRFKDANMGASVISQSAADEGSRTGIKGSGILSLVNVGGGMAEPSTSKQKSAISVPEPGSSTPLRRQGGSTSASRQMTIFYGGQAHVFDDVHPNKADVIMALAGSNGGSWSTSYSPHSAGKPSAGETIPAGGENDTGIAGNSGLPIRDIHGRLYVAGNSSHGVVSSDQMSMLPGAQGSVLKTDARRPTRAAAEPSSEGKL